MIRRKIVVGIDPDVDFSGVAWLDVFSRKLKVTSMAFPRVLSFIRECQEEAAAEGCDFTVVVEAGWLNKGNWHVLSSDNKGQACVKGYYVGRNHQVGICICEVARSMGVDVVEQLPLRKYWSGKDKKITAVELSEITGLQGRTTQDARDAALIAWTYAGLPIKISARKRQKGCV